MSLTPALCASMLKPVEKGHHFHKRGFWGWFNRKFDATTHRYEGWVGGVLKRSPIYLLVYLLIVGAVGLLFVRLPSAFLPVEDQGYFINFIQLPVGATQERTVNVLKKMESYFFSQPQVKDVIDVAGFSFAGQAQNSALAFVHLKPWRERRGQANDVPAIIRQAFAGLGNITEALVIPINQPPTP